MKTIWRLLLPNSPQMGWGHAREVVLCSTPCRWKQVTLQRDSVFTQCKKSCVCECRKMSGMGRKSRESGARQSYEEFWGRGWWRHLLRGQEKRWEYEGFVVIMTGSITDYVFFFLVLLWTPQSFYKWARTALLNRELDFQSSIQIYVKSIWRSHVKYGLCQPEGRGLRIKAGLCAQEVCSGAWSAGVVRQLAAPRPTSLPRWRNVITSWAGTVGPCNPGPRHSSWGTPALH